MSFNTNPIIVHDIPIKSEKTIRVMTYNVHGFNSKDWKDTTEDIFSQLKIINPDIFGIQEIHLGCPDRQTINEYKETFERMGYKIKFSQCFVNVVGSKYDFDVEELDIGIGTGILRRCALIGKNFQITNNVDNNLIVCTTHLEVSDKMAHLRTTQIQSILSKINAQSSAGKVLIIGDFNSLRKNDYDKNQWNEIVLIDKKRGVKTIQDVIPIIENYQYVDSFVSHKSIIPSVTVWTDRRVDYIYTKNINVNNTFLINTGLSDHYPVIADVSIYHTF